MKKFLNIKTLIIILAVLVVIGWGLAIYFGLQVKNPNCAYDEKLEKLNAYAVLLDKSMKLVQEDRSLDILEMDVRLLNNGSLLNVWQDVVFGGNKKEDIDYYYAIIIDALKFFSKTK